MKEFGKDFNPFLHIQKEEIIDKSKNFIIIAARAPYAEDHLLIIPKRQVYLLKELSELEKNEMWKLLEKWVKKLNKKHKHINLLLRDGLVGWGIWKSVNHFHFHLIPDCWIGSEESLGKDSRKWLSDEEYIQKTEKIRERFARTISKKTSLK